MLLRSGHDQLPLSQTPLPDQPAPSATPSSSSATARPTKPARTSKQQRKSRPNDPELLFQIARSYLVDFYRLQDPEQPPHLPRPRHGDPRRRPQSRPQPHPRPARQSRHPRPRRAALLRPQPLLRARRPRRQTRAPRQRLPPQPQRVDVRRGPLHQRERPPRPPRPADRPRPLHRDARAGDRRDHPLQQRGVRRALPDGQHALPPRQFPQAIVYYQQDAAAQRHAGSAHVHPARNGRRATTALGDYIEAARKFYDALQIAQQPRRPVALPPRLGPGKEPAPALPAVRALPSRRQSKRRPRQPARCSPSRTSRPPSASTTSTATAPSPGATSTATATSTAIVAGSGTFLRVYRNDGAKFTARHRRRRPRTTSPPATRST